MSATLSSSQAVARRGCGTAGERSNKYSYDSSFVLMSPMPAKFTSSDFVKDMVQIVDAKGIKTLTGLLNKTAIM